MKFRALLALALLWLSGPCLALTDNFTGADESPLGAPWTADSSFGGVSRISNAAGNSSPGDKLSYRTDAATGFTQITVGTIGDADGGVSLAYGGGSHYTAAIFGTTLYVFRHTSGGSFAEIISGGLGGQTPLVNGNTLSLARVGNGLSVKVNGVEIWSGSDATHAGPGYSGIFMHSSTMRISSWTDGASSSTAVPIFLQQMSRHEPANDPFYRAPLRAFSGVLK